MMIVYVIICNGQKSDGVIAGAHLPWIEISWVDTNNFAHGGGFIRQFTRLLVEQRSFSSPLHFLA